MRPSSILGNAWLTGPFSPTQGTRAARGAAPTSRQLCRDAVPTLPSDPDKHFPLPQPPAEGPEDGEDEEALGEGAVGAFEEGVA